MKRTAPWPLVAALVLTLFLAGLGWSAESPPANGPDPLMTPLMRAALDGDYTILMRLLEQKPDLEARNREGDTALLVALAAGNALPATELINAGANVNATGGRYGLTPLMLASVNGFNKLAEMLIERGAKVDAKSFHNQTPLYLAAYKGHAEMVTLLMKHGARVDEKDNLNQTPLYLAVQGGHEYVAKLLLDAGADPNIHSGPQEETPLMVAAAIGQDDLVRLLLRSGARLEARDATEKTALMMAAANGHFEVCETLLREGANFDTKDNEGLSALAWAAQNGHGKIVKLMLSGNVRSRNYQRDWK